MDIYIGVAQATVRRPGLSDHNRENAKHPTPYNILKIQTYHHLLNSVLTKKDILPQWSTNKEGYVVF